jgi:hypothetical protein
MPRASKLLLPSLALASVFFCLTPLAGAAAPTDLLSTISSLVEEERYGDAIREAEAAADRGIFDADLSFNRGLSYLKRAKTSATEPGDLAQAAAGFAEALVLNPDDAEAERGLEQARLLIAQDRTQTSTTPDSSNLGILEQVLKALSPFVLATISAFGSLTLSLGLWLFSSPRSSRKNAAGIVALVGTLLLVPALLLAGLRHLVFHDAAVAVVIAEGAEVVDAGGKRIAGRLSYRKGTVLHVGPSAGGLAPLLNFGEEGFVPIERVRLLHRVR